MGSQECARLDWSVLKVFAATSNPLARYLIVFQWNQPSIDFYEKKLNATAMSEWMGMRLEEDGIEKLKLLD